jgi:hypothetical protein
MLAIWHMTLFPTFLQFPKKSTNKTKAEPPFNYSCSLNTVEIFLLFELTIPNVRNCDSFQ